MDAARQSAARCVGNLEPQFTITIPLSGMSKPPARRQERRPRQPAGESASSGDASRDG
jgi:hypothetical protein